MYEIVVPLVGGHQAELDKPTWLIHWMQTTAVNMAHTLHTVKFVVALTPPPTLLYVHASKRHKPSDFFPPPIMPCA